MPPMPSDLEIARATALRPIAEVAARAHIPDELVEPRGRHVAKIDLAAIDALAHRPAARYIVVTAVTPTPLGEGKTTTAVGLAQGIAALGHDTMLTLRQPSMGPTFGVKGGAAGGGYSQVVPMETLNLHLTGDFHAVTAAHNLLAAMIDSHLHHGNELDLEPHSISWRRVLDVNDRALRNTVVGLGARIDGVPRESGFDITAASEVMVILALATSLRDLRRRLGRIVVGYTRAGAAVTAEDLRAAGAMAVILKDALNPNLMQTTEQTPVLIHTGPFGNIATGNSSVVADMLAIRTADYVLTEAGFGADMGAERFFNIKCRMAGLTPHAAVLVVTVRALKLHSGRHRVVAGRPLPEEMLAESPDDVRAGADNLRKHIAIVRSFGVAPVVAINAFPTDHPSEHEVIASIARDAGALVAVATHVPDGGAGAREGRRRGLRAGGDVLHPDLRPDGSAPDEDREGRDRRLRSRRRRPDPRGRSRAGALRGPRLRRAARRDRQDPPVDLLRSRAQGRPHRLATAGPRGAPGGGCRLRLRRLRRHAHDAGPVQAARRAHHRHRRGRQRRRPVLTGAAAQQAGCAVT
jgi:formate--tetrahydrofolate ligase